METRLKYYLWIAATSVTIAVGLNVIWQSCRPKHHLEADILTTKAPMSFDLAQDLRELSKFSLDNIRKRTDIEALKTIPDEILKQTQPVYEAITKSKVETLLDSALGPPEYLTVATIRNTGDNTLTGVELKSKYAFSFRQHAQIYRDSEEPEIQPFTKSIEIGKMSPRSEVTIYFWNRLPTFFASSAVLSHRDGIGTIYDYSPALRFPTERRGIWISYYWTTVILAIILAVVLLGPRIYLLIKRRSKGKKEPC